MPTTNDHPTSREEYPAKRCSVSYRLYGKNAGGEWKQIGISYKSQGDAEDAMQDYMDTFVAIGEGGWHGFCIVRRIIVEETISPNPTGLRCAGLDAHKQDPVVGQPELTK